MRNNNAWLLQLESSFQVHDLLKEHRVPLRYTPHHDSSRRLMTGKNFLRTFLETVFALLLAEVAVRVSVIADRVCRRIPVAPCTDLRGLVSARVHGTALG